MNISNVKRFLLNRIRQFQKKILSKTLAVNGYKPGLRSYIDELPDEDLIELNNLLDWNSFISDGKGRRFGMAAWGTKRIEPQAIPDKRIIAMHERFNLSGQHVLEVGCFEGVHTLGLLQYAGKVTAVDSRVDHVVKTIVRCAMFGYHPAVFKYDIENVPADDLLLQADLIHHVGVLYHLSNPVNHLIDLGRYINTGVMLDTHYCLPEDATEFFQVNGKNYYYKRYLEYGKKEAFSGMNDHSKWLLLDDIINCLHEAGFGKVEIIEKRQERNGPRVLLFAARI